MRVPRGLLAGAAAALALIWSLEVLVPGGSAVSAAVQSGVCLALCGLTVVNRRAKVALVRTVQRWAINPLVRLLLTVGVNPLGLALLETRGRVSGSPRRTPVGNGRSGDSFWVIAEHGGRAGYVRNILADPHVRVRLRVGWRYRWVPGVATVLPDDDPLARQRRIIRWHPLRALNAVFVRVLGADLLTVHVRLLPTAPRPHPRRAATVLASGRGADAEAQVNEERDQGVLTGLGPVTRPADVRAAAVAGARPPPTPPSRR